MPIPVILLTLAFCLFLIGTFIGPPPAPGPWYGRFNIVSAGLACWSLSELMGHWR